MSAFFVINTKKSKKRGYFENKIHILMLNKIKKCDKLVDTLFYLVL